MSVTGRPLTKGCIARIRDGEMEGVLTFKFNPTSNTEEVAPSYTMIDPPGSSFPTAVFKSVSSQEVSFRLLLDAVEEYYEESLGISAEKAFIESLGRQDLSPYLEGAASFVAPPVSLVCLGSDAWYTALTSLSFEVIRRNRNLVPTRAWADLTFSSIYMGKSYTQKYYKNLNTLRKTRETSSVNVWEGVPLLG
jgi:hypothetical protein